MTYLRLHLVVPVVLALFALPTGANAGVAFISDMQITLKTEPVQGQVCLINPDLNGVWARQVALSIAARYGDAPDSVRMIFDCGDIVEACASVPDTSRNEYELYLGIMSLIDPGIRISNSFNCGVHAPGCGEDEFNTCCPCQEEVHVRFRADTDILQAVPGNHDNRSVSGNTCGTSPPPQQIDIPDVIDQFGTVFGWGTSQHMDVDDIDGIRVVGTFALSEADTAAVRCS